MLTSSFILGLLILSVWTRWKGGVAKNPTGGVAVPVPSVEVHRIAHSDESCDS